ncbi:hypothetical protein Tco_0417946 [Tanacetum coccineum]
MHTATREINLEDATRLSSSSGTPSIVEKSPLDFSNEDSPRRITESDGTKNQGQETVAPEVPLQENVPTMGVTPEIGLEKEVAAMGPFVSKKRRERGGDRVDVNAPPKVLRKDHETPADVSDPDPLSYAKPRSIPEREIAHAIGSQLMLSVRQGVPGTTEESHKKRVSVIKRKPGGPVRSRGLAKGDAEAYDPEANDKFVKALQDLKDLKYPIVDQVERLKDSPIDLIMASLHLKSDTGEDAPQWIRDLRPSSSQLKDAIAANISRAEKKKKCRVVCRTHGVGSAHHARSDGVAVSVPTAAPQGLAILLTDAATQTEGSEGEVSPRLIRSKSLPPILIRSGHSTACGT